MSATTDLSIDQLARERKTALDNAEAERRDARDAAHRAFVIGVRHIMVAENLTVVEAAARAGLTRGVLHDLIKRYS